MSAQLTCIDLASFRLVAADGTVVYLDPWVTSNRGVLEYEKHVGRAGLVLIFFGRGDYIDPAIPEMAEQASAKIVGPTSLRNYFSAKGAAIESINPGETLTIGSVAVTKTLTIHNPDTSHEPGASLQRPCGYIIRSPGTPTIYYAEDTGVFGDMRLIGETYSPEIAFLPIHGWYTVEPIEAVRVSQMLKVSRVVPVRFGPFPSSPGTIEEFRQHLKGCAELLAMQPGETLSL